MKAKEIRALAREKWLYEQVLDQLQPVVPQLQAVARALLRHALGERADTLAVTVEPPAFGRNGLAAGVEQALVDGLRTTARAHGLRLGSLRPRLVVELNLAVVIVTHDLGVAAQMADTVGVMYAGRLVESAPAQDLFADARFADGDSALVTENWDFIARCLLQDYYRAV